jgi:hypothetical protein
VPFKEQLNSQSALIYINSLPLGTQIMVEIYLADGANLVEAIRLAPQTIALVYSHRRPTAACLWWFSLSMPR